MKNEVEVNNKVADRVIKKMLYHVNLMCLKSNEKVAYYYEDMKNGTTFSYNKNMLFYAASAIKILVALYLYINKEDELDQELIIEASDIKKGTGILNDHNIGMKYSIRDLIKYSIMESDNTSYVKLVNYVSKKELASFGKSLGALHTMEGKETDCFGIINASDMIIYLKRIREYLLNGKYGDEFGKYLSNPSFKIIKDSSIGNNVFYRKYGSFDQAFHECGIVMDQNPFYLIILTQKNKKKEKQSFVNKVSKKLFKIHLKLHK